MIHLRRNECENFQPQLINLPRSKGHTTVTWACAGMIRVSTMDQFWPHLFYRVRSNYCTRFEIAGGEKQPTSKVAGLISSKESTGLQKHNWFNLWVWLGVHFCFSHFLLALFYQYILKGCQYNENGVMRNKKQRHILYTRTENNSIHWSFFTRFQFHSVLLWFFPRVDKNISYIIPYKVSYLNEVN